MIRKVMYKDLNTVLQSAAKFYPTTHYAETDELDVDSVTDVIMDLIDNGVFLLDETDDGAFTGMIGIVAHPFLFNRNNIKGYELIWWVEPAYQHTGIGIQLLAEAAALCKAKGINAIQMTHMTNSPPQAAKALVKAGYFHSESSYTLRL